MALGCGSLSDCSEGHTRRQSGRTVPWRTDAAHECTSSIEKSTRQVHHDSLVQQAKGPAASNILRWNLGSRIERASLVLNGFVDLAAMDCDILGGLRSEEHTSELQSPMY